jgi:hypothetical protein
MSRFYITNESTEDTFDSTDDLPNAILLAKEVARSGQVGNPINVERDGKVIKQYILTPDGHVQEQAIVSSSCLEGGSDAA